MATTYNHIQLGIVDASGNVNVLYPQTTADVVNITTGEDSSISLQSLYNSLGEMAYDDGDNLVYIDEGVDDRSSSESEINDYVTSLDSTWSSKKINAIIPDNFKDGTLNNPVTSDMLNYPYSKPMTFCGIGSTSSVNVSPVKGGLFFVKYNPISVTQVSGSSQYIASIATQEWIRFNGVDGEDTSLREVYYRVYYNNAWHGFIKLSN